MYKYYLSIFFFTPFLMQAMQQDEPIFVCPPTPKKVRFAQKKVSQVRPLLNLCLNPLIKNLRNMPESEKTETITMLLTAGLPNIFEELIGQMDHKDPNRIEVCTARLNNVLNRKRKLMDDKATQ